MNRAKASPFLVILAGVTLVMSSWGLFGLAHTYSHMPAPLALFVVAGFDLFALAAGHHALQVAGDGDSAAPWYALVVVVALFTAWLQYAHGRLAGWPTPSCLVAATFPIATVITFEGTLRRVHRLNARSVGQAASPPATFEWRMWAFHPARTGRAYSLALLDRTLSADAAMKIVTLDDMRRRQQPAAGPPPRREIALSYADILSGHVLGPVGDAGDSRDVSRVNGNVAATVRAQVRDGVTDYATVADAVRDQIPDASDTAIRRAYQRATADTQSGQTG